MRFCAAIQLSVGGIYPVKSGALVIKRSGPRGIYLVNGEGFCSSTESGESQANRGRDDLLNSYWSGG